MKMLIPLLAWTVMLLPATGHTQSGRKPDLLTKANNTVNKVSNVIAVFQPYLLKARQLFFDSKQLAQDVRQTSRNTFGRNGNNNNNQGNNGYTNAANNQQQNTGTDTAQYSNGYTNNANSGNNYNNGYTNNTQTGNGNQNNGYTNNTPNNNGYTNNTNAGNPSPQNYLPNQNLPVNNPSTINTDGTGNWGNQNNGLYGNCLDVMTGTVMGLGEAEEAPKSVDVIFIAANESYQLWTPSYARNEVAAEYTSRSTYESVTRWSDANETEIAETHITIGQFDQIQNNSQILNAVKNAQNYASSLTEFGKLDGKVFAVKAELENRTVYGLIAVVKQVGTYGSSGYLKIRIKAQGIDLNQNGQPDANAYVR